MSTVGAMFDEVIRLENPWWKKEREEIIRFEFDKRE